MKNIKENPRFVTMPQVHPAQVDCLCNVPGYSYMINSSKYVTIHKWLKTNYGKAFRCEFCDSKTSKRYEWALKKGYDYDFKRDNFIQLCPSCHRKYDYTDEQRHNVTIRMRNNPSDPLGIRIKKYMGLKGGLNPKAKKIYSIDSNNNIEYFDSVSDAVRLYNYNQTSISSCLIGKNKTAYGKQWKYQISKGDERKGKVAELFATT